MKKVLPLIGSAIILGGFLAFSLQSTGKLTSTEECNAVVLADEELTGDTITCCSGCNGRYCGYFVPDGSSDKIRVYYEY